MTVTMDTILGFACLIVVGLFLLGFLKTFWSVRPKAEDNWHENANGITGGHNPHNQGHNGHTDGF